MSRKISLKDIAKKLNLTINTVSRALRDGDDISLKTKQLVKKTAEEMGYIPNIIASSMRTLKTSTIGIVFDNLKNPYFMLMANAINEHLLEHGYQMMIFTIKEIELKMNTLKKMVSRNIDGIITFLKPEQDVADFVNQTKIPMIVVGREADDINIDSIFTDDRMGGYLMGEYLYHKGYRKVGYLGGPLKIVCNLMRAEGIAKFYQEQNIKIDIIHTNDANLIAKSVDKLINNGIEAIFCFNDQTAYDVQLYVNYKYQNRSIEITGYDNIASQMKLPIFNVTIGTDVEYMIKEAITQLLNKINHFDLSLYMKIVPTFLVK